ncbi:hypothetical protein D3C86_1861940 [compost metagenome]
MRGERGRHRQGDGFHAGGPRLDLADRRLDGAEAFLNPAIQEAATFGQPGPASYPLEQLHTQVFLHARQHPADRRLTDTQLVRRTGETAASRRRFEDEQ